MTLSFRLANDLFGLQIRIMRERCKDIAVVDTALPVETTILLFRKVSIDTS